MDYDKDKASEAALALMFLTFHDQNPFDKSYRAWKGISWELLDHLHEKGLIHDPVNKNKSVALTPEGTAKAEELFYSLFGNDSQDSD